MRRRRACSLAAWLLVALAAGSAAGQEVFDPPTRAFAAQLDLSAVERLGVQDAGRVKILDTFAREQLDAMLGEVPGGVRPTFAYLELLLRPQAYLDVPLLEVKGDALRDRLAAHLPAEDAERLRDTGRLPPRALLDERGADALRLEIRGAAPGAEPAAGDGEHVQSVLASAEAADPALRRARERLLNGYFAFLGWPSLRIVPPPGEGEWLSADQLAHLAEPPEAHAGHAHAPPAPEVRERAAEMQSLLTELGRAWRARDAQRTNAALGRLAARLHELSPSQQPSPARAWAELAYNRLYRFTIAWVGYAGAFVVLLAAVVRPRRRWRVAGLALLALSTAVLAAGMGIRWWLSGRPWYLPPVTGQFESVVSAALLGACVALVLERIRPRNTFALAGAFFALIALLLAFLLPDHMRAEIRPPQGILNNWILPLHVGTIILGYAMIAIGLVLSVVYLLTLARGRARAAGPWSAGPDLSAASPPGALADVDRCNLIVAQLACWMVGVGTILGAWWADYSWGRWWGWDPKEVWALITWIVYLAILHVRYVVPARTRGLWTAGLTVAGAAVMLFNWVVVKYILPSLHGYA